MRIKKAIIKIMEISKKKMFIILSMMMILVFAACDKIKYFNTNEEKDKDSFVSVKGYHLYKDEIDKLTPKGIAYEDSIAIVEKFIEDWILDKLLYEQAQKNLGDNKEIDELVNNFRKTLMLNKYKTMLIDEKLSKTPKESEIIKFYENNPEMFQLNDEIIKGLYVKIPKNSYELKTFQKLFSDTTNEAILTMEQKKLQNTIAFENFYDKWIDLNDVLDNLPLKVQDHKEFLKKNKNLEISDSTFVYLLNISDYKIDGVAPFDYVKNKVTSTYKNYLQDKLLKDLNRKLFEKAKMNNEIIYQND